MTDSGWFQSSRYDPSPPTELHKGLRVGRSLSERQFVEGAERRERSTVTPGISVAPESDSEVALMGLWLEGWTGDNAGRIAGRKPNTLLVSATFTPNDYPAGIMDAPFEIGPFPLPNLSVDCLTPNARHAEVVDIQWSKGLTDAWSLEVAEIAYGPGLDPWEPGVHLFAVHTSAHSGPEPIYATTLATAVIESSVRRIAFAEPGEAADHLHALEQWRQAHQKSAGSSSRH